MFPYFSNPLLYAENGRDDYIHLEKYVMIGNYNNDPDRFDFIDDWLRGFLRTMDQDGPEAQELAAARVWPVGGSACRACVPGVAPRAAGWAGS